MKTLDLHGNKHNDVDRVVENFTLLEEFPHKIITGKSTQMNNLVLKVLERHNCVWDYETPGNWGSIVVKGKYDG